MFDTQRVEIEWGGRKLSLETGRVARQADAAVFAQYGETSVLATVVAEKSARPGIDFFPLTVNYQEKTYAAGKIPGGFFKREGRPSEKETLTSRLIDRPIRPLFVDGFKNETQVVVTVLSHDMENDPDIVALVAASAALTLSGVPFLGPIGAARVGVIDGQFVLNPMIDEMAQERSRPGGGRHRRCRDDGGVGGQGAAREADAGGRHVRPPRLPAGDQCHHQAGREGGQGAVELPAARQVQVHGQGQGAGRGGPAQGLRDPGEAEAPRADRGRQAPRSRRSCCPPTRTPTSRCCSAPSSRASSRRSCAATSSARSSASTAATCTTVRPDRRPRCTCCRARTARRCSRAARRRPSWWPRSAPARTSSSSMRWRARAKSASCCTTTSRRSRWARRAAWARPAGARSATASSPGAPCTR